MKDVDGKKIRVCQDRGGLPVDAIRGTYDIVVRKFGNLCIDAAGNVRFPLQWVIGPDEKVIEVVANGDKEQGFGAVQPPDLAARLNVIAKRHGPALSSAQYQKITALLAEGDELMKKGDWTAAAAKYREVVAATKKKINAVVEAEAKLDRIATHADEEFAAAEKDVSEGRFEEALDRLTDVASKFRGTKAESKAKGILEELAKNPEVKKILASRKGEAVAAEMFEKAVAYERRKRWKDALETYKACAERYPRMPSGKKAAKRAAEIEADESIMKSIREVAAARDCKRWLSLAKNFIGNNLPDRARPYLEKIIATYPGTRWAEQAAKLLADLK
jgi:tetratricopeptide (TPR) repeat protein